MELWLTINFSQYDICSSMVANSLPEDTHSTLALSYIISRLVRALLLNNFYLSKRSSAGTRRVVVSFLCRYVHEVLLNSLVKLVMKKLWFHPQLTSPNLYHEVKNKLIVFVFYSL